MNGSDRRAVLDDRPEGAEVVLADQGLPGSLHRGNVERDPHPERMALAKRAARPVPDGVAVLPVPRRMTRVELPGHPSDAADGDVRRELAVEGRLERRSIQPAGVGEGDHLPRGVDAGIGSAGPVDRSPHPIAEAGERGLELSLDRPDARPLDLEAGKVRSVVFNGRAAADRGGLSPT